MSLINYDEESGKEAGLVSVAFGVSEERYNELVKSSHERIDNFQSENNGINIPRALFIAIEECEDASEVALLAFDVGQQIGYNKAKQEEAALSNLDKLMEALGKSKSED